MKENNDERERKGYNNTEMLEFMSLSFVLSLLFEQRTCYFSTKTERTF